MATAGHGAVLQAKERGLFVFPMSCSKKAPDNGIDFIRPQQNTAACISFANMIHCALHCFQVN
jgi:hypothetical protein